MLHLRPPNVYETYQDVKNNLLYWALLLVALSLVPVIFFYLPPGSPQKLYSLLTQITLVGNVGLGSLALLIWGMIALFLANVIQIHDRIYDKYVIKWRHQYDTEFILPRLVDPFKSKLSADFIQKAGSSLHAFMGPYYDYVGDRKSGIEQNTRVRFYEAITTYWLTQLFEIFLIAHLIVAPLLIIFSTTDFSTAGFAWFELLLLLAFIANRYFIRRVLSSVRQATQDEIDEIMASQANVQDLESKFLALDKKFTR